MDDNNIAVDLSVFLDNAIFAPDDGMVVPVFDGTYDVLPETEEEIDAFLEHGGIIRTFAISNHAYDSFEEKFSLNGKRTIPTILEYNKWKIEYQK